MRKYFFKAAFIALIAVLATFLSAGLVSLNGEKALADGDGGLLKLTRIRP